MQNSTNNILNAKYHNDMQIAKHKTQETYKHANIILFIYPKYTNNIPIIC